MEECSKVWALCFCLVPGFCLFVLVKETLILVLSFKPFPKMTTFSAFFFFPNFPNARAVKPGPCPARLVKINPEHQVYALAFHGRAHPEMGFLWYFPVVLLAKDVQWMLENTDFLSGIKMAIGRSNLGKIDFSSQEMPQMDASQLPGLAA